MQTACTNTLLATEKLISQALLPLVLNPKYANEMFDKWFDHAEEPLFADSLFADNEEAHYDNDDSLAR
jgi:hypothetical protein